MSLTLTIEAKIIGQKTPVFTDWSITLPPSEEHPGDQLRLRDLITRIVLNEVESFEQRQSQRRLLRVMSKDAIEQAVNHGKVDLGGHEIETTPIDRVAAIKTALQAFEDDLYFVFIDGVQAHRLDEEVQVKTNSRILFVRLTPLAGG